MTCHIRLPWNQTWSSNSTLANFKRDAQPSNKPDSDAAGLLFCLNSVKRGDLVAVHECSDGQEAHSPTVVFHRDDHVHTVRKAEICSRKLVVEDARKD